MTKPVPPPPDFKPRYFLDLLDNKLGKISPEELNLQNTARCEICGHGRGKPGGHKKCAKIRKAFYDNLRKESKK